MNEPRKAFFVQFIISKAFPKIIDELNLKENVRADNHFGHSRKMKDLAIIPTWLVLLMQKSNYHCYSSAFVSTKLFRVCMLSLLTPLWLMILQLT